jgi:diguanylate cyclase (GGDEF)-like protein
MAIDYSSLLFALGISGACLTVTLLMSWVFARTERFLLTWAVAVMLIVAYTLGYALYVEQPNAVLGAICFGILMSALVALVCAAREFRFGRARVGDAVAAATIGTVVSATPLLLGYSGLAFIILNLAAAALLAFTAREYWRGRAEAPGPITALAVLYGVLSGGFLLCAAALAVEGRMILDGAPQNWAEDFSLALSLAGMTGIGALSLALNHWRSAARHRMEARTDPLTGLMNRRALFDQFEARPVNAFTAVFAFDLDDFKLVNDRHGHAAGDEVIRAFASILHDIVGNRGYAARLGGEEFAVVIPRLEPKAAEEIADRIRDMLAAAPVPTQGGPVDATVSVGLAFGETDGSRFDEVLLRADKALYVAKRRGRNRIVASPVRLAG